MSDARIEEAKAALRKVAHKKRASLHPSLRSEAAAAATAHFFEHVPLHSGEVVAGYWPIRDELDIRSIVARLMDAGQPVCLPVVVGDEQPLELRLWQEGASLYEAGYGTLAPADDAPRAEPDVILMPLLGFDKHGTRLGYGGGYYDRTLAALGRRPRLIGFAFTLQEVDDIPREGHDVPLDAIVTEAGVRVFEKAPVT
ncbi:MAG: 5-formyltetrahydrofolate cyclo-ligase [Devosia sp.]|uniref:5-formyltetrahydrofolate cyclo-ligase n=1 Tax=Devosia sp. TaxID=1871048 RepID=UPI001ACF6DE5|nr:5-formyltetrahydrofolate cyclo-ligase [Devosia sp.]MBN9308938.1 5-formyltetrahydrofolate cyclo-ligase [Devosia sp.]MBN9317850.1 5-formyltetrahydrofolate cyclo-ligase [Devosia sp.]